MVYRLPWCPGKTATKETQQLLLIRVDEDVLLSVETGKHIHGIFRSQEVGSCVLRELGMGKSCQLEPQAIIQEDCERPWLAGAFCKEQFHAR